MDDFSQWKQKRVRREPTIDGIPVDEFTAKNADPIWRHQNEMWEDMQDESNESQQNFPREPWDAEIDICSPFGNNRADGFYQLTRRTSLVLGASVEDLPKRLSYPLCRSF